MQTHQLDPSQLFLAGSGAPEGGHARAFCWTTAPGGPTPLVLLYSTGSDFDDAHVYPGPEFLTGGWLMQPQGWRGLSREELDTIASGFRPKMFNETTMKPVLEHKELLPSGTGSGFSWERKGTTLIAQDIRNSEEAFELAADAIPSFFLQPDGTFWYSDLDSVNVLKPGQTMVQAVPLDPTPAMQIEGLFVSDAIYLWRCFGPDRELRVHQLDGTGVLSLMIPPDSNWLKPTAETRPSLVVGAETAALLQGDRIMGFPRKF